MQTVIRAFDFSDYAAARHLWEQSEGIGLSEADEPDAIRAYLLRNPGLSFVAIKSTELAGTILCGHDGRRGLIHHLVTAGPHRRQRIASALLQRGLAALRAAGIHKCLFVVFNTNTAGLAFWRKIGAEERTTLTLFSISTGTSLPVSSNDLPCGAG